MYFCNSRVTCRLDSQIEKNKKDISQTTRGKVYITFRIHKMNRYSVGVGLLWNDKGQIRGGRKKYISGAVRHYEVF